MKVKKRSACTTTTTSIRRRSVGIGPLRGQGFGTRTSFQNFF